VTSLSTKSAMAACEPVAKASLMNPALSTAKSAECPIEKSSKPTTTVFFDGACPLCAAEIDFYRKRRGAERLTLVDVSTCPDGTVAEGLTTDEARKRFHVLRDDGRIVSGGQAFTAIWSSLPSFSWLSWIFRARPLAWVLDRAYDIFLRWRPFAQRVAKYLSRKQTKSATEWASQRK